MKLSDKTLKRVVALLELVRHNYTSNYSINWYRGMLKGPISYQTTRRLFQILETLGCVEISSKHLFNKERNSFSTVWCCLYKQDLPDRLSNRIMEMNNSFGRLREIRKLLESGTITCVKDVIVQTGLPKATVYRYIDKLQAKNAPVPERRPYSKPCPAPQLTEQPQVSYKSPLTTEQREFFIEYDEALGVKDAAAKRAALPAKIVYDEECNEAIMLKRWIDNPDTFSPPAGLVVPMWLSRLLNLEPVKPNNMGFKLFGGYPLEMTSDIDF